ncbi:hypothetical protein BIV57_13555 [Mangrovactinospora gilvigrisea]|uniref:Integral membrane protein n=1 Tax=Mangrovactinospora gilvigrisea TaxID=1428644 RepID=A0A1J7BU87_9ACTN|nr:hypothetical protein [Mangrovactinospora gilvigrisea]OIV37009.1 hypothetical protein BIV57_13555 [Mangrovactinospora gilvigrisea]
MLRMPKYRAMRMKWVLIVVGALLAFGVAAAAADPHGGQPAPHPSYLNPHPNPLHSASTSPLNPARPSAGASPAATPAPSAPSPSASSAPGGAGAGDGSGLSDVPTDSPLYGMSQQQVAKLRSSNDAAMAKNLKALRNTKPISAFDVRDQRGIPISLYTVSGDTGDWTDWQSKTANFLTMLIFSAIKWLTGFLCWALSQILNFSVVKIIITPLLHVYATLNHMLGRLGLAAFCLTLGGFVAGWIVVFKSRSRGFGEMLVSATIAAVATTLLAAPIPTLVGTGHDDGALGRTRAAALQATSMVVNGRETNTSDIAKPLTNALTEVFVVRTSQWLGYETTFEGRCADQYSQLVIKQAAWERTATTIGDRLKSGNIIPGPIGWTVDKLNELSLSQARQIGAAQPSAAFESACVPGSAKDAHKANVDKVGAASFVLIALLVVGALIVILGGMFVIAQIKIGLEALMVQPALMVGTVPGGGRGFLYRRISELVTALLALLLSLLYLAIGLTLMRYVLSATKLPLPGGLAVRFLLLDVIAIAVIVYRKRLSQGLKAVGANVRAKLEHARIGGSAGSVLPNGSPAHGGGGGWGSGGGRGGGLMANAVRGLTGMGAGGGYGSRGGLMGTAALLAVGAGGGLVARRAAAAAGRSLTPRNIVRRLGKIIDSPTTARLGKAAGSTGRGVLRHTIGLPVSGPQTVRNVKARARREAARQRQDLNHTRQHLATAARRAAGYGRTYAHNTGAQWAAQHLASAVRPTPPQVQQPAPRVNLNRPPRRNSPSAQPTLQRLPGRLRRPPTTKPAALQTPAMARMFTLLDAHHRHGYRPINLTPPSYSSPVLPRAVQQPRRQP